jgi:hypothetical protein
MTRAEKYRRTAEEMDREAQHADSDADRMAFRRLADEWRRMAMEAERGVRRDS